MITIIKRHINTEMYVPCVWPNVEIKCNILTLFLPVSKLEYSFSTMAIATPGNQRVRCYWKANKWWIAVKGQGHIANIVEIKAITSKYC